MAVLRVIEGRSTAVEFEIDRRLVIGRGEDCDVRIFDETCSRRHAFVEPSGDGFFVEDMSSSNGTFVRGSRAARLALSDGDEIAIGATRFKVSLAAQTDKGTVMISQKDEEAVSVHSSIEHKDFKVVSGSDKLEDLDRLSKAYQAGSTLSGVLDEQAVIDKTVDLMMDELGADRAAVLRETAAGLEMAGSRGRRGTKGLVLSSAVMKQVSKDRKAVVIRDAVSDPRFRDRDSLIGQDVRSAVCVPLLSGNDLLGFLYADRTKGDRPFEKKDLETLMSIGTQVAPALRNAEAFAREKSRIRDMEQAMGFGSGLIGDSPEFRKLMDLVGRAAGTDSTVLLRGETGTGKELLARALHEGSTRKSGPFIAVNCAALVGSLLESELFGHEKGSFTGAIGRKPGKFELAQGGTLFLDEVGEMAPEMQAKLLRAIESREFYRVGGTVPVHVDIRIVAATNRDLAAEVESRAFRQDLFYRLSVVTIDVPPLRLRRQDVPALVAHALKIAAEKVKRKVKSVSQAAMEALCAYSWPGNIRELLNVIERAVVLAPGQEIGLDLLPPEMTGKQQGAPAAAGPVMTLREAERQAIARALAHTGWKKGETAELLGISWPTLNKKIEEYGIKKTD